MSPEAATVLIFGGSIGVAALLMLAVACCCGTAVAGVGATDCDRPPDRTRYPEAYARWERECKWKRRNQVAKVVQMQMPTETAALVQWR